MRVLFKEKVIVLVENDNDDGVVLELAWSSHELISSLIKGVIQGQVVEREEDKQNATKNHFLVY